MNDQVTKLAQEINLVPDSGIAFTAGNLNITALIPKMVNLLFVIAVVVFFFMLVIGGIRWISSGGDKNQTDSARSQITSAIIGLVIVLSTYAIISLIDAFFGINIIEGLNLNV